MSHFKVVRSQFKFRILNTKTGSLNQKVFTKRINAVKYIGQLEYWTKLNASPNGKKRTAKHNIKVVKRYHQTGLQPKDFNK